MSKNERMGLVCSKCGILAPDDDFLIGFMAAMHNRRFTNNKHKLSLEKVKGKDKIATEWEIALLLGLARRKDLYVAARDKDSKTATH